MSTAIVVDYDVDYEHVDELYNLSEVDSTDESDVDIIVPTNVVPHSIFHEN